MAILRAGHLARPSTENSGPTLLVTHTNALVTYLRHLAEGEIQGVQIETYAKFARGYLSALGLMSWNSIASVNSRNSALARTRIELSDDDDAAFFQRPIEFFSDELEWIDGSGLRKLRDYLGAERVGRKEPLQPSQRKALWKFRNRYLELRTEAGYQRDWSGIAGELNRALMSDESPRRYRHIVVDEAQDLAPEAIRSLALAIQPGGSLTLFIDESQQIYGQRTSWRSCGLTVARIEPFTDNYRNTPEIAAIALEMAAMPHFQDTPDIVMPVAPRRAAGARPTLYKARDHGALMTEMARQASTLGRSARVAILSQTHAGANEAARYVTGAQRLHREMPAWDDGPGVYYGTFHAAKGLEFEIVIVPSAESAELPAAELIDAFGDAEARARSARMLYVGVTRARSELLIGYVSELTYLLPPATSDLWARVTQR